MLSPSSRRGRVARVATAVALSAALLGPAGAHADSVTMGPGDLDNTGAGESLTPYTFVQVSDNRQSTLTAPADGVITDWNVSVAVPGSVRLLALEPQWNDTYILQGATPEISASGTGATFFPFPLQVKSGYAIGLQVLNGAKVWAQPDFGAVARIRNDLDPAATFEPFRNYDFLFNAHLQLTPSPPPPPTLGEGGGTGDGDGGDGSNDNGDGGDQTGGGNTGGGTGGGTSSSSSETSTAQTSEPAAQQSSAPAPVYATNSAQPASRVAVQRRPARLSRRGVAAIRVSCSAGAGCAGLLRLVLPLAHRKQLTLGRAYFALPGGQTGTVAVRLTRVGRRAIVRRHGATVLAVVTDRSGTSRSGLLLRAR